MLMKLSSKKGKDEKGNLKLVDIPITGSDHKSLMRNVYMLFGNVFIVNGSYRFPKKPDKEKKVFYIKLTQTEETPTNTFPFISPNMISPQTEDVVLIAGYKSLVNSAGDFCFLNHQSENMKWSSEIDYIKNRIGEKCFLIDDETKNNDAQQHFSYLILAPYLFNGSKALHINYIVKKKGVNDFNTKAFIRFLNFVQDYITKNKIFYFTIMGNSNISSAKWRKITNKIFKDSCYMSPGTESEFITDIDTKHGARANRFIIISKTMAPYGVYFYLTQQKIDYFSTSNILVAEILENGSYEKNINDDTKRIYDSFQNEMRINSALHLDLETDNDVNLESFDLKEVGIYKPINGKPIPIKTLIE